MVMKNPDKTDFNIKVIAKWTESEFVKWWKLHSFSGDAKEWYAKLVPKPKKKVD